jgi:RNA binding exosome subunit
MKFDLDKILPLVIENNKYNKDSIMELRFDDKGWHIRYDKNHSIQEEFTQMCKNDACIDCDRENECFTNFIKYIIEKR